MSELIDNRAHRIRQLKRIIQDLHAGVAADDVRQRLRDVVGQTDATEIAAMEQSLIADEGMPVSEVQAMCDAHAEVLREITVDRPAIDVPPGHPIDTFRRENQAIAEVTSRIRQRLAQWEAMPDDAPADDALREVQVDLGPLMDVDKHYQRKEHLLFSCLERHGILGPSKVMWGKHDEARAALSAAEEACSASGVLAGELKLVAPTVIEPALDGVEGMVEKEERILLPLAFQTLTEREWGEVWSGSPEYGWCLVEPRTGYEPPGAAQAPRAAALAPDEAVMFPSGALTPKELLFLFRALPVDITFVDADDRVRFFSDGGGRVFARSKAIIGRKVQHCHPPKSVDVVGRILEDFRSGAQSVAEFWIELHGKFVHIRYFAVRDDDGVYLGTLEVTQDATHVRSLEGQRRLLEYGTAGSLEA